MTLDHLYATFKENVCVRVHYKIFLWFMQEVSQTFMIFSAGSPPCLVYPFLFFLSTICVYLIEDKNF